MSIQLKTPGLKLNFHYWIDRDGRRCTTAAVSITKLANEKPTRDIAATIAAYARCSLKDRFSRAEGRVRALAVLLDLLAITNVRLFNEVYETSKPWLLAYETRGNDAVLRKALRRVRDLTERQHGETL